MNKVTLAGLACAFFSLPLFVAAQKNVGDPYPDSREIAIGAIEKHQKGEYKEAITALESIPDGDTLYDLARYELALSLNADSQCVRSIEVLDELLSRASSQRLSLLVLKAAALDKNKQTIESVECLKPLITDYGYLHQGYFETAGTYRNAKKYDKALENYIESLRINPLHPGTHVNIGLMAAEADQPALAFMAIYFATIVGNDNPDNVLNYLNITELIGKNEYKKFFEGYDPELFSFASELQEINDIVLSKAALSPKYKSKVKVNYTYAKQLQVICERLPVKCENSNPILQFYTTFYKAMWDQGHFAGMATQPLVAVDNPEIKSLTKKNSKKINAFASAASEWLDDKQVNVSYMEKGEKKQGDFFMAKGQVSAIGKLNSAEMPEGAWHFYHDNGELSSEGSFTNGKKQGLWKFYSTYGFLRSTENYKDGELHGLATYYNDFGVPTEEKEMVNGKQVGKTASYHTTGAKAYDLVVKNDQIDGIVMKYDENGNKSEEMKFANGELVDSFKGYHTNGKLEYEMKVVNGKTEGPVKFYDDEGHVVSEGQVAGGDRVGKWKFYFPDGKTEQEGSYENGKMTGVWTRYFKDGKPEVTYTYKNDKLDGVTSTYDENGKLLSKVDYRNGKGTNFAYLDADGKTIFESKLSGGKLQVQNYNQLRIKSSEGLAVKDELDGEWKTYYTGGALKIVDHYKDGKLDGLMKSFYPTGQVEKEIMYKDGLAQGYYRKYHITGYIEEEGYYLDDRLHGEVREYYPEGKLKNREFYWKGEKSGRDVAYNYDGTRSGSYLYRNGIIIQSVGYDKQDKPIKVVDVPNGNGEYGLYHVNGQPRYTGAMKYGCLEGHVVTKDPQGAVLAEADYFNGRMNGPAKFYYTEGKVAREGAYKNGRQEGPWKYYLRDGSPYYTSTYSEGDREGEFVLYHRNGKVYQERNYRNDERHGAMKIYSEDGTLIAILNYSDGVLLSYTYNGTDGKPVKEIAIANNTGTVKAFYPSGKPSLSFGLKNGEYDGDFITYSPNGKVLEQYGNKDGMRSGLYTMTSSSGQKLEEFTYVDDMMTGTEKNYYANGKLKSEETYLLDELHGPAKYYDANGKVISEGEYHYGDFIRKK